MIPKNNKKLCRFLKAATYETGGTNVSQQLYIIPYCEKFSGLNGSTRGSMNLDKKIMINDNSMMCRVLDVDASLLDAYDWAICCDGSSIGSSRLMLLVLSNVKFEIKSQFMRELREYTFSGNKNDDAHEHVERILDIVSLFNIPGVTHDAVMLRDGWSKTHGEAIQTMAHHSQKWHDGSNSRNVSSGSSDGIAAIANKLDSLGRDMKKLKENVHAIQGGCQTSGGVHHDKEGPLRPPGYYISVDNRPSFGEKIPNLEELMNKHLEESTRRRADMEDWMKKLKESRNMNTRNQNASLKNLETRVEQLTKDYQAKVSKKTDEGLNLYAMADLDASVNIMPYAMFKCLKLTSLKETKMLVEITDMSKKAPIGIAENVLVKIDKFIFPTDFVIIDMLGDPNETTILGEDRIMFNINQNIHHPTVLVEKVYMVNSVQEEELFNPLEISEDLFSYDSLLCLEIKKYNHLYETNQNNEDTIVSDNKHGQFGGRKRKTKMGEPGTGTLRLHYCKPIQELSNGTFKLWPTCDPNLNECNCGNTIYILDERGALKKWYCHRDNERRDITGKEKLFSDFPLIRYGNNKIDDTTRAMRYNEWFAKNSEHQNYGNNSLPYLGDYTIAPGRNNNSDNMENLILSIKSYFPNSS
ncbi:DNA-binding pseudobarrel domain-containing protein [Tanacetum coccineum]